MPSTPPGFREESDDYSGSVPLPQTNADQSPSAIDSQAISSVASAITAALSASVAPDARLAIALSGGVDSMVLLDAIARVATAGSLRLSAIHIHHGLSPNADRWARFCADQCAARNVPLTVCRVQLTRARGQSLEALARAARYERLKSCAVDVIALAHHADDQAETVLLQLLRGAGPRGLSAMPACSPGAPALLRPLLQLPRQVLAAYANVHGLDWIEDESNADTRHRRNLLREKIAPLLATSFGGYPATLVRAASHQAEASALLDELAVIDAEGAISDSGLDRARLASLSDARAANLLRWFLRGEGLRPPSDARLADALRQLRHAAADARTRIIHDGAEIGCYRGRVVVHAPAAESFEVTWQGAPELRLPGGILRFERTVGDGIASPKLALAPVNVRSRAGGERIRLAMNRPRHSVKRLLQRANLSVWERQALPLVWCGDALVAIPGLGVDIAFQASAGEEGWRMSWRPAQWQSASSTR